MKFCPVIPEICRGQVHVPKKERRRKRIIIIIIKKKIIIRNGANNYYIITISQELFLGFTLEKLVFKLQCMSNINSILKCLFTN